MIHSYKRSLKAYLRILLLILLVSGCKTGDSREIGSPIEQQPVAGADEWLKNLIQLLKNEKATNPPAKIYRYFYKDQVVYYVTSRCCDRPGELYNIDGNKICEPDGGITGKGDGRCTTFFDERSDETLIWEDKREI
jgi:hypothetical protein